MTPSQTVPPERTQAAFAATLVDEWVRCGVTDAVVAPGSRSTPLVLALDAHPRIKVHVHVDERSAAFMAFGLGLARGRPALVVTTSGTAAAHLHPAVLEAHHARVPLIACTADRPSHLHHVGAPQTIEQRDLFAGATRWSHEPGLATGVPRSTWRALAARAFSEAVSGPSGPGPVHLNLAFDEPLVAEPSELPPGRENGAPWFTVLLPGSSEMSLQPLSGNGVVVAGWRAGGNAAGLGEALGWPVLADPRSGARGRSNAIAAFDPILRALGDELRPEIVVRVGDPPASKVLAAWLASLDAATHVLVDPHGSFADPDRTASIVLRTSPAAGCTALADACAPADPEWLQRWSSAEAAAQKAIDDVLAGYPALTEPTVARTLTEHLGEEVAIFVASSMPIRDVEWFGHPQQRAKVRANRGANGIDGLVSTAVGVALSGRPTVAVLGDLAFLHDSNGLLGLRDREVDCAFVVVDNRGGGIFSFLPQASALPAERFERLFGTPQPVDIAALSEAHGIPAERVETEGDLTSALDNAGPRVIIVQSERGANVAVHEALNRAVAAALVGS